MPQFKKIAIIGVGLIGGSIGLAIKKKKIAAEVIGVSRHQRTLSLAKKIRAIDYGSLDLRAVKDADLIIFAAPIE
ncbi:MAG: prephenate dehydrogenase/arogenate dehydrogenase family protein, partial [Candidatus Omnitrophica bacterium]|nr:prephenate dehydrogenase/arogenate dehydrogenase family protein [Candidatus Omnitrophota bacterium]